MEAPIPSWCILCSLVLTTNCMSIFIQSFKCSFKSCGCSISLEARINILSALVFLSLAGWRLFLDGRSVCFWLSELSFWSAEGATLLAELFLYSCFSCVFFYVLSLSLSLSLSFSLSQSQSFISRCLTSCLWSAIVATCTPQPTCRVLISTLGMSRNPRASQNLHEQRINFESYIRAGSHHPETGCTTNTLSPHCCSSQRQLLHDQRYLCTRMS